MLFLAPKRPERPIVRGRGVIPIERIKDLTSKGFTEQEIIDMLRREGFSPEEIDKGLTHVLKASVTEKKPAPPAPEPMELPKAEPPAAKPPAPAPPVLPAPVESPPIIMPQVPEQSLPEEYYYPEGYSTEEYIDYMIKEKTSEINEKINEFILKYKELEAKIASMHERLAEVAETKVSEQQLIGTKIDSLKDVVTDVDARLSSLETAFKETLPALIESVRSLTDLVQRMKREA